MSEFVKSGNMLCEDTVNQFSLFELDKMAVDLKYSRRERRKINGIEYQIESPLEAVSSKMQKIKNSGTSIENLLEAELIRNKIVYTKPSTIIEELHGKPDFVLPRSRVAIFCDGDFWHGKEYAAGTIKNNTDFWDAKIARNIVRDEEVNYQLENKNWTPLRFWESDIKNNIQGCIEKIKSIIYTIEAKRVYTFTFVDLFSGIGGFRIPLEKLGGKCLGFSEIDKKAIEVYKKNFLNTLLDDEIELGDITNLGKLPFKSIDLLVGGVPCQAWSVAGKMKGFDDPRGRLWLDTIRVVKENKPKAFIFENVKGLKDPRNKESLDLIINTFRNLGYHVPEPELLNSYDFGLPQNRDRIFIVGVRGDLTQFFKEFKYPKPISDCALLKDILKDVRTDKILDKSLCADLIHGTKIPRGISRFQDVNTLNEFFVFCDTRNGHTTIHSWDILTTTQREKLICETLLKNRRKKKYGNSDGNPLQLSHLEDLIPNLKKSELDRLISKKILRYVLDKGYEFVNSKNSSGINGIYRIYLPHSKIFSTLTATGTRDFVALVDVYGGSPKEYKQNFINEVVKKKLFREITAKEAGKLQGFPNWFSVHEDSKYAKKQFGNAVSTSVVFYMVQSIIDTNVLYDDSTRKRVDSSKVQRVV